MTQKKIGTVASHPQPSNPKSVVIHRPAEESFLQKTVHDPVAAFTGILALATILLWIFTAKLWRATVELSRDAKQSGEEQAMRMERSIHEASRAACAMEEVAASTARNVESIEQNLLISRQIAQQQDAYARAQMRAYISVLIGSALYQDSRLKFEARPLIANNGNTPAKNIQYKIAAEILPVPLPNDFKFSFPRRKYRDGSNILGAQQNGTMAAVVDGRVPEEDVAAIKIADGKALYVWGVIRYDDIFGKTHRCTFAQQLSWEQSGPLAENGEIPEAVKGWYLHRHNRTN